MFLTYQIVLAVLLSHYIHIAKGYLSNISLVSYQSRPISYFIKWLFSEEEWKMNHNEVMYPVQSLLSYSVNLRQSVAAFVSAI